MESTQREKEEWTSTHFYDDFLLFDIFTNDLLSECSISRFEFIIGECFEKVLCEINASLEAYTMKEILNTSLEACTMKEILKTSLLGEKVKISYLGHLSPLFHSFYPLHLFLYDVYFVGKYDVFKIAWKEEYTSIVKSAKLCKEKLLVAYVISHYFSLFYLIIL